MADKAFSLVDKLIIESPVVKTTAGDVVMGNSGVCVVKKASGAATQVTLTARAQSGYLALVKDGKGDAGTNNITIIPDATTNNTTIDGSANFILSVNYAAALFMHDGTEWGLVTLFDASISQAELAFLDGVVAGTQAANKAVVADSNVNTGVSKVTQLWIGASGSESQVTATPTQINVASLAASATRTSTTTDTVTAADHGVTIFLNNATGYVTTLPAPIAGFACTFINKTANTSGNHTIVTNSSANIIKGNQNSVAGDAGDSGTGDDTINFVANSSVAGDKVELMCDGTSWFAYAISRVAAGITFTTAS